MILKTLKQKLSVEKFPSKLIFPYLHLEFPSWNFLVPKKKNKMTLSPRKTI